MLELLPWLLESFGHVLGFFWRYWIRLNLSATTLIICLWMWEFYSSTGKIFTIRLPFTSHPSLFTLLIFRLQLRPFRLLRALILQQKDKRALATSLLVYFLGFPLPLYYSCQAYYRYARANNQWNPLVVFRDLHMPLYAQFYSAAIYVIDGRVYVNCSQVQNLTPIINALRVHTKNPVIMANIIREVNQKYSDLLISDPRKTTWDYLTTPQTGIKHPTKVINGVLHIGTSNYQNWKNTTATGIIRDLQKPNSKNPQIYTWDEKFTIPSTEMKTARKIPVTQLQEEIYLHNLPKNHPSWQVLSDRTTELWEEGREHAEKIARKNDINPQKLDPVFYAAIQNPTHILHVHSLSADELKREVTMALRRDWDD